MATESSPPVSSPAEAERILISVRTKLERAGVSEVSLRGQLSILQRFLSGEHSEISEDSINPIDSLPTLDSLPRVGDESGALLDQLVVIKLNGGLGTSMGLEQAKSLLEVKDGFNFLDLMARQILSLRQQSGRHVRFLLMNSFNTRADTLNYLGRYPDLAGEERLDFLQSKMTKLDVGAGYLPAEYPADPDKEWCPPGHGDIYAALFDSGVLSDLVQKRGVRYAFISNSDNLGALPDPAVLAWMHHEGIPFIMEVTRRTAADRKGGHLARRLSDGRLILREGAQTRDADVDYFQNIDRHCFFNTNNLWVDLQALHQNVTQQGFFKLPYIVNKKPLVPSDPASRPVIQLETAMGAAIECFAGARAIEVPRSRFAPVKKTDDLMALRSDAYEITRDSRIRLAASRGETPPDVRLDKAYQMIRDFDRLVPRVPSLIDCQSLDVVGPVQFTQPVSIQGRVRIKSECGIELPAGTYSDREFIF